MPVELATVRDDLVAALSGIEDVEVYRHKQVNYQFPAFVVGWPRSMDVRPTFSGQRDFTIDVTVGVEMIDPESSDARLSALLEQAVDALQADPTWDVQPITDFGEELLNDSRVVVWCRLPVAVFA